MVQQQQNMAKKRTKHDLQVDKSNNLKKTEEWNPALFKKGAATYQKHKL